jgi:hypothetical protein
MRAARTFRRVECAGSRDYGEDQDVGREGTGPPRDGRETSESWSAQSAEAAARRIWERRGGGHRRHSRRQQSDTEIQQDVVSAEKETTAEFTRTTETDVGGKLFPLHHSPTTVD